MKQLLSEKIIIMECKCKESPKGWTLEHFETLVLHTKTKLKNVDHDFEM
jgi:hypothetical protein